MIHTDYCSSCKEKKILLVKYSKTTTTQYYLCRACNNARVNKYRATGRGKKAIYKAQLRTRTKAPHKHNARVAVYEAVKKGGITKATACEICNVNGRIEGHHMDYTKPLEVIWLCTSCHANYHH